MSKAKPSPADGPSPAESPSAIPDLKTRATAIKFELILLGIVVVSVLLRIWMSVQVVATDPFAVDPPDVTDMATYHALSRGILYHPSRRHRDGTGSRGGHQRIYRT